MATAIDPADYDVVGLRELALRERRRSGRHAPLSAPGRPGSPLGDLAEPDRRSAWLGSHDERHKPYLRRIPRERALRETLREWLERLVERVGPRGTADALGHYERLGWITESVEDELRAVLPDHDPDIDPDVGESGVDDLTRADHVRSLAVISLAQLRAEGERPATGRPPSPETAARSRPRSRSRLRERSPTPPRGRPP